MPPSTRTALTTSRKVRPSSSTSSGSSSASPCRPRTSSWIAFTPVQGRAECALSPLKVTRAWMLPRQPAWRMQSVGSSTTASCASRDEAAVEERGQRALRNRNLLAREEEVAAGNAGARELDHHRDARLHVARAEPVHGAVRDAARDVPLGGNRVEMPGEHDRPVAVEEHLAVVVERAARARARARARREPPRSGFPRARRRAGASGMRDRESARQAS